MLITLEKGWPLPKIATKRKREKSKKFFSFCLGNFAVCKGVKSQEITLLNVVCMWLLMVSSLSFVRKNSQFCSRKNKFVIRLGKRLAVATNCYKNEVEK